jgi:transposase
MEMGRPRRIDQQMMELARAAAQRATTVDELRAAQAVLLPAQCGATVTQTAELLGVGRASVGRLQARFRKTTQIGPPPPRNWGGRRHELLTPKQEIAFLAPWLETARAGGMLVVAPVRAALAEQLGKPVKPSVVYGLLARHGWRKVAPDTAHPKSDPVAQDDWKKNCRKNWRPC